MKHQKILYILNIAKKVNNFSYTSMIAARKLGLEFHIAGNWSYATEKERELDEKKYGIKIYQIDFIRTPYHPRNRKAYVQLKQLILREKYDMIHCNTPIGGVLGRILGRQCKVPKIIYQAHGFHFYKGAPKINWLLYYPVEKWLARYTDVLITINKEDYKFAKNNLKLRKNGNVYYIPGVGIDVKHYFDVKVNKIEKRKKLNLSGDDFVALSVGRLDANKNNNALIKAVVETKSPTLKLVVCGDGEERSTLEEFAKSLGIESQVVFLGNRADMNEIYSVADCLVMASFREGLSRTIMEAMSTGLPCIVSKIRGNVDLIEDGVNGYLCDATDYVAFADAMNDISKNRIVKDKMSRANLEKIKHYDISVVEEKIKDIYNEILN